VTTLPDPVGEYLVFFPLLQVFDLGGNQGVVSLAAE
jgi:hypothetical protein